MDKDSNIKKELEQEGIDFNGLKKENPFKVPQDYFSGFEQELAEHILKQNEDVPAKRYANERQGFFAKLFGIVRQPRTILAICFLPVILTFGVFMASSLLSGPSYDNYLSDVSQEGYEIYIEENFDSFESLIYEDEDLLSTLEKEDEIDAYIEEYLLFDLEDDDIIDLL